MLQGTAQALNEDLTLNRFCSFLNLGFLFLFLPPQFSGTLRPRVSVALLKGPLG